MEIHQNQGPILCTRVRERSKITAKLTAGEGNTWHTCSRKEQNNSQAHSRGRQHFAHVSEKGAKLESSSQTGRAIFCTRVRERSQVRVMFTAGKGNTLHTCSRKQLSWTSVVKHGESIMPYSVDPVFQ